MKASCPAHCGPLSGNFRDRLITATAVGIWFLPLIGLAGCDRGTTADHDRPVDLEARGDAPAASPVGASGPPVPFQFVDVTEPWGVDFSYRNGEEQAEFAILESLGGGIALLDFDRDSHLDLFCPGGGTFQEQTVVGLPAGLFRNLDGRGMVSVTDEAGEGFAARSYSHGAFAADYNNDGFQDVLVSGYGGLQLWQNQGDGTFTEVHQSAGLDDRQWSSAAAWGDFDNDGALDLYVAHYVNWSFDNHPVCRGSTAEERDICPPREYMPLRDSLYLSHGDGTFRDATDQWGLRDDGKGLGALVADFDGNGYVDIYVANDTTNNFLYANDGQPPLREIAVISGAAADKAGIPNGSMGVDLCDFDRSGRADIWVTNYEREDFALYRNEGPAAFLHVSDIAGLNVLGGLFVGFGTKCADLDLDGQEDILVNNGHVILHPTASPRKQLPLAMLADNKRFTRAKFAADNYLMQPHDGRGLAVGDLDHDGDMDAVYANNNAPLAVLRNDLAKPAKWLQVELVGTRSARSAIGATVTAVVDGQPLLRIRHGGGSYMSTSQQALAWGLGAAEQVERLTVRWPSGAETVMDHVDANQTVRIVEPRDG